MIQLKGSLIRNKTQKNVVLSDLGVRVYPGMELDLSIFNDMSQIQNSKDLAYFIQTGDLEFVSDKKQAKSQVATKGIKRPIVKTQAIKVIKPEVQQETIPQIPGVYPDASGVNAQGITKTAPKFRLSPDISFPRKNGAPSAQDPRVMKQAAAIVNVNGVPTPVSPLADLEQFSNVKDPIVINRNGTPQVVGGITKQSPKFDVPTEGNSKGMMLAEIQSSTLITRLEDYIINENDPVIVKASIERLCQLGVYTTAEADAGVAVDKLQALGIVEDQQAALDFVDNLINTYSNEEMVGEQS